MLLYSVGVIARLDVCPMPMVMPSGLACDNRPRPILPPAPGRFSTTMFQPVSSVMACAIVRDDASVPPAGGNGTIMVIGPDGYLLCARAIPGSDSKGAAAMP